jgi:hypothetical protein
MRTLCIVGAVLLAPISGAVADNVKPRVTGIFLSSPGAHAVVVPTEEISCEAQIAAFTAATCTRPCTTWAHAQPDFAYSYDACVANCPKRNFGLVFKEGRLEPCRTP